MNLAKLLLVLMPLIAPIANLQAGNEDLFSIVETSRSKPSPIAYAVEIARPDVVKFLIDRNEDVNKSTRTTSVYYNSGDWHPVVRRVADETGQTPLDLAIEKHNAEFVQILLQYHPTKNANVEYEVVRYQPEHLFTRYLDGFESSTSIPQKRSSPLIDPIIRYYLKKAHPKRI